MGPSVEPYRCLRPVLVFIVVNKLNHYLCVRSSSAWAKKAAALRMISLACLNFLFSRSSIWCALCHFALVQNLVCFSRHACFAMIVAFQDCNQYLTLWLESLPSWRDSRSLLQSTCERRVLWSRGCSFVLSQIVEPPTITGRFNWLKAIINYK